MTTNLLASVLSFENKTSSKWKYHY
jgi:hypothetical protein